MSELSDSDVTHLSVLEKGPFQPIGWLYSDVYCDLVDRGFAHHSINGFHLSPLGREALDQARQEKAT